MHVLKLLKGLKFEVINALLLPKMKLREIKIGNMTWQLPVSLLLVITTSCGFFKPKVRCGNDPKIMRKAFPKEGTESRVAEYKRVAVMDTITAVIEGQIIVLPTKEAFPFADIILESSQNKYAVNSGTEGQFKFVHIQPGTYSITSSYVFYRPLRVDSLKVGSGNGYEMKIEMGSKGWEELGIEKRK